MRKSFGLIILIVGLCGFATLWQMNHGGGSSFMTGGNWTIPRESVTEETRRSITMNGRKRTAPIWNAALSSERI